MTNVHIRKVGEKPYRLFKSAAVKKSISLSRAFEDAVSTWISSSDEISDDQRINDMTYRKMKKELEKKFPDKYIVIAEGKLQGTCDSVEKAWGAASPFESALVTKIVKRPIRAKMLGSSLRLAKSLDV